MSDYAFVTRWSFQAPVEAVWQLLSEPEDWPRWWPGVEKVELLERGSDGDVGTLRRFTWKSRLPYRLAFDMRSLFRPWWFERVGMSRQRLSRR